MEGSSKGEQTLREALKMRTARLHDRLDDALAGAALSNDSDYAGFLLTQYRARQPIDLWIADNLPSEGAPPAQAPLIAADLQALGRPLPQTGTFTLPGDADPVGLQWALAGSSLGNRAMLARRRKAGIEGPEAFLSDAAMPRYFAGLRPLIERPASEQSIRRAVAGAEAVFAAFLAALQPVRAAA